MRDARNRSGMRDHLNPRCLEYGVGHEHAVADPSCPRGSDVRRGFSDRRATATGSSCNSDNISRSGKLARPRRPRRLSRPSRDCRDRTAHRGATRGASGVRRHHRVPCVGAWKPSLCRNQWRPFRALRLGTLLSDGSGRNEIRRHCGVGPGFDRRRAARGRWNTGHH